MSAPDLSPPMAHVFVDFENVKHVDLEVFGNRTVNFTLLVGVQQKNLPVELVGKMMEHAASVQLIRMAKPGKNALDFSLAYYLGQAVLSDPRGFFHLISKDKGYDPLIEHLRSRHVNVQRHDDYSTLPFISPPQVITKEGAQSPKPKVTVKMVAPAKPKAPAVPPKLVRLSSQELEKRALDHLRTKTTGRPTRQKTLLTHLVDHFRKKTTEAEVRKLIENWCAKGLLEKVDVPNTAGNFKITAYNL
jgi:hypothetical protein